MTIIRVGDIIFVQAPLCLVMTLLLAVVAVVFRTHVPVLQVHIVHIVFKISRLKTAYCVVDSGMGYFIHMFKTRISAVIENMTAHRKPRAIVVCMIYFLDETPGE